MAGEQGRQTLCAALADLEISVRRSAQHVQRCAAMAASRVRISSPGRSAHPGSWQAWQDWTCRQGKQGWGCNLACAAGQDARGRAWWRLPRMASRARHETQGFVRLYCPRPGRSEASDARQQSQGPGQPLSASCLDGTLSAATWPADPWPLPSRALSCAGALGNPCPGCFPLRTCALDCLRLFCARH